MITKIFLYWVFGLVMVTYLGTKALPLLPNSGIGAVAAGRNFNYFLSLAQWDGGNYIHIAKEGFTQTKYFAFAPVYPLSLRIISLAFKHELVIGILLSSISFFLFLKILHKYLTQKYKNIVASNTIISYLVFPTTFFCLIVYSESLFLLLILLSIIFLEKNKMLLSATLAGVATLTRFIGVFFVFSQIYFIFKHKKFNFKNISLMFTLTPIGSYAFFFFFKYNEPFIFINVQNQWGRFGQDPITTVFAYFWNIATSVDISPNTLLDFSITVLFLMLLIKGIGKIPGHLWIFSALVILIPASTGTLIGMPRYVLPSIGTFIILGGILGNSKFKYVIWSFSLALQCFLAGLFITGHWVA
jgi:Gpi18-like mannosyltransferase